MNDEGTDLEYVSEEKMTGIIWDYSLKNNNCFFKENPGLFSEKIRDTNMDVVFVRGSYNTI